MNIKKIRAFLLKRDTFLIYFVIRMGYYIVTEILGYSDSKYFLSNLNLVHNIWNCLIQYFELLMFIVIIDYFGSKKD